MGGTCGTHGKKEKCIRGLFQKPEGRFCLEYLGVDGWIILMYFL